MVCVECLNKVTSACEIKRQCLEADEKLKKYLINREKLNDSQDDYDSREKLGNTLSEEDVSRINEARNVKKPNTEKTFSCDTCNFSTKRKKNLERHLICVHIKSNKKFSCYFENCDRQYTTQTALNLHQVRDHDKISPYKCEKCNQKFSCESLFRIHSLRLSCRPRKNNSVKTTIEKSLSCLHCKFKTAHQFSLKQHVELIHLKIRKYFKCSHCEKEFSNRTALSQHIFNFHNLSHIRCSECDQAFLTETQMKNHKESLKCNARKATDDDFEETINGVKCNLCSRIYQSKKKWVTHFFNHHKFSSICNVCNIQLSTYASLRNHKRTIHEKIKRFECTQCRKTFSAKHTLDFHLNIHSGIKPFSCSFCSFKASDKSSVSKHQKKLHSNINKN